MKQRILLFIRSIRFRLAAWFVVILAVVLVAFSVFVYTRQKADLRMGTLDRLTYKTRKWENVLNYGGQEYFLNQRALPAFGIVNQEQLLQENDVLALVDLQSQVVQKIGLISDEEVLDLVKTGAEETIQNDVLSMSAVAAPGGGNAHPQEYLFIVTPISYNRIVIGFFVLGSPIDPNGQLYRLLLTLVIGNLATLGLALAGGYWLANRAMHPVQTITRAAQQISATDLSRRINLKSQDELGELADTFDAMLARLQAAFERQRQFTADASHELRTPLTIVDLEASRALSAPRSSQEYVRALKVIQSENQFMTRLVNNLLTLARMDAGQVTLQKDELDLGDLVLEVVERLAPLAQKQQVRLSLGDLPEMPILGDRLLLSQMLTNLIDNAIKYSSNQDAYIEVSGGTAGSSPEKLAWVRVTDNGPGIPPQHLPHLFDRFYQVDQARTQQESDESSTGEQVPSGAGLGLSIAQWIARAHGGEIRVQSEVGKGSTFEVVLPLK